MKEESDIDRAQETVETVAQQLAELDEQFKEETAALEHSLDPQNEELETVTLKPTKANISVRLLTLAWMPYWEIGGQRTPAWK
jgi:hypothetical protein